MLNLYLRPPETPRRLSRHDLRLVRRLWERQIPLITVETPLLLASVRRNSRPADAIPLAPIRSLHTSRGHRGVAAVGVHGDLS